MEDKPVALAIFGPARSHRSVDRPPAEQPCAVHAWDRPREPAWRGSRRLATGPLGRRRRASYPLRPLLQARLGGRGEVAFENRQAEPHTPGLPSAGLPPVRV